jgi:hypothetical protein
MKLTEESINFLIELINKANNEKIMDVHTLLLEEIMLVLLIKQKKENRFMAHMKHKIY